MRSYPIYHVVEACNYKSSKSYGSIDTGKTAVVVGTSKKNSKPLVTHSTTRRTEGDYTVFRFGVDLHDGNGLNVLRTLWMHTKTREWYTTAPVELTA